MDQHAAFASQAILPETIGRLQTLSLFGDLDTLLSEPGSDPLVRRGRSCGASSIAQTRKLVADRKEEEFQFWWRVERSQTLKQPDGVPLSAKERMEALRARIVAKSGSAQSASSVAPCAES